MCWRSRVPTSPPPRGADPLGRNLMTTSKFKSIRKLPRSKCTALLKTFPIMVRKLSSLFQVTTELFRSVQHATVGKYLYTKRICTFFDHTSYIHSQAHFNLTCDMISKILSRLWGVKASHLYSRKAVIQLESRLGWRLTWCLRGFTQSVQTCHSRHNPNLYRFRIRKILPTSFDAGNFYAQLRQRPQITQKWIKEPRK